MEELDILELSFACLSIIGGVKRKPETMLMSELQKKQRMHEPTMDESKQNDQKMDATQEIEMNKPKGIRLCRQIPEDAKMDCDDNSGKVLTRVGHLLVWKTKGERAWGQELPTTCGKSLKSNQLMARAVFR